MFSQACVILFTGGGVCLSSCWDTPPDQAPPPEQTPPDQAPPREQTPLAQSMLGDTVNARAVRILLECNLVDKIITVVTSIARKRPIWQREW